VVKSPRSESETLTAVLARNVQVFRESRGWSQEQLAEAAGVSRQTISSVERGVRLPDVGTLQAIAGALDVQSQLLLEPSRGAVEVERIRDKLRSFTPDERSRFFRGVEEILDAAERRRR
jgi:transcriptional regulator with XRE-family HTH domain